MTKTNHTFTIKMTFYSHAPEPLATPRVFRISPERPLALLQKCPVYVPTSLTTLPALAQELGIAQLFAKDESSRMGLGSFKALGGAFAVAQMICEAADTDDPMDGAAHELAAGMTFVTASAGNHGLSVAAGAKIFGAKSVVVLPAAAPEAFVQRISAMGATVKRSGSYEDSVAEAIRSADEKGWIHLADGSWTGYVEPPALIMEGYTVLAEECRRAFVEAGTWPTHVFLQAGVGGLAASLAAHIREVWSEQPHIVVVEPDAAPCLLESVKAGKLTHAGGPDSNMGRLDCKDASMIAFDSLRCDANAFLTISDHDAELASAMLARHGMVTTPSGAAGLAGLIAVAPGPQSRCLIIVSEGSENG